MWIARSRNDTDARIRGRGSGFIVPCQSVLTIELTRRRVIAPAVTVSDATCSGPQVNGVGDCTLLANADLTQLLGSLPRRSLTPMFILPFLIASSCTNMPVCR